MSRNLLLTCLTAFLGMVHMSLHLRLVLGQMIADKRFVDYHNQCIQLDTLQAYKLN